jgi:hypothetical protein
MENLFRHVGFRCLRTNVFGPREHIGLAPIVLTWKSMRGKRWSMNWALCPVCGFHDPKSRDKTREVPPPSLPKRIAKRLWPTRAGRRWLLGVFERT